MSVFSYTNKGLRLKNEDYLLSEQLNPDMSFHIVADGMGGYSYGEKASRIVVETIFDQVRKVDISVVTREFIIQACEKANHEIQKEGIRLSSKIGSTFAAALIVKDKVFAFWMGDARIYQYDENNQLLFQSEDHSLINELKSSRKLTASEIQKYESIVTRSLTGELMETPPQIEILQYSDKGKLLLCSDGLYKQINPSVAIEMSEEELLLYLASTESKMKDNYSIIRIN